MYLCLLDCKSPGPKSVLSFQPACLCKTARLVARVKVCRYDSLKSTIDNSVIEKGCPLLTHHFGFWLNKIARFIVLHEPVPCIVTCNGWLALS